MKNKQTILYGVIAVLVLLLLGGGAYAYTKMKAKPAEVIQEQPKKKKVADPVNVLAADQRPYVKIVPVDARNLQVEVVSVKKPADNAEYELEYQAGSLLQGAFGNLELGELPAEAKVLLGSCSAGGACTYHTDVKGGTLLTRFQGPENYALKSDWKYVENGTKDDEISSKDAKFQLKAADLKTHRLLIIFNTPGYPEGLTGTPVSDPYSLTSAGTFKGKGELTMRGAEEGALKIKGWDGSKWHDFETKVDGKSATATVDLMELYILVKE